MGNSLSSSKPAPAPPDAASRGDRQRCWDNRDAYFACLDKAEVVKAGDEGKTCASEKARYGDNCAKSWIEYFNQRRIIAHAQKTRLGAAAQTQVDNARSN